MLWWATRVATALWPSIRALLIRVGRWVLRRIARKGFKRIVHYMEERITRFEHKAATRSSKVARRFNAARAKRWAALVEWLYAHKSKLSKRVARRLNGIAKHTIPRNVRCETFAGWCVEEGIEGVAV